MKDFNITVPVHVCAMEDLDPEELMLVQAAKDAAMESYAPYSHFHVGAAILMQNGEIVPGSNQENAAFGAGTCAERTACFSASAQYPGIPMKKIAVAAWTKLHAPEDATPDECFQKKPVAPCGICRQALMEYENLYGPIEVIMYGSEEVYKLKSVSDLLPLTFTGF